MELLIIFAVFGIFFIFIGVSIYNKIINNYNAVERGWANVINQERQKNKIIPHLESVVEQYKEFETGLQTKIAELRSALQNLNPEKIDSQSLMQAEQKTMHLLKGINIAVENYPELKASDLFNNLMREITEQQENIGASIRIFNQNVEAFNNGIQEFPNSLINGAFNKKSKIQIFSDQEAQQGFDYKPNFN